MALTITQSSQIYGKRERLVTYTGSDPAANTEWSETVPAGKSWRVQAIRATLVTDATVANRQVAFTVDDGVNVIHNSFCVGTQPASQTQGYNGSTLPSRAFAGSDNYMALPELILGPGYRIRSATSSIQALDNWGAPVICVIETYE